jgi:IclR family pca regulon transcriptional regulator
MALPGRSEDPLKPPKLITSVHRCFEILEAFTPEEPRLTLQGLTVKIGLPKTTIHRLLHTLMSSNYIACDSQKRYFLGSKFASLGMSVLASMEVREIALPFLEDLSRRSQQNVSLGILDRTEVMYICRVEKRSIIPMTLKIGSRLNCHQTSMGRAILAFLDAEQLQNVLKELTRDIAAANVVGSRGEHLRKVLQEVRRKGYALSDEEWILGVRSIAAPVFNMQGRVEAAVNMPVISAAISRNKLIKEFLPRLLATAEKISSSLGYISARWENSGRVSFQHKGQPVESRRGRSPDKSQFQVK